MKPFRLALFLVLLSGAVRAEIPPGWDSDYREALARSKTNREPLLIYFTASWCAPCKRMARTTLGDSGLTEVLKGIAHIALDIDEQPILAEQHKVAAVPTFQVVLGSAAPIATLSGFQEPGELTTWIKSGVDLARKTAQLQEQIAAQFAGIDEGLRSSEAQSRSNAVAQLIAILAQPGEGSRDKVLARLNGLPAGDLVHMLEGLQHKSLSVRIQVAGLLRVRAGEAFDVDCWADAESRKRQVEEWRQKLPSLNLK